MQALVGAPLRLCDFAKHARLTLRCHGPGEVTVQNAKRIPRQDGFVQGLLGLTETREVERLVVRHRDGRTELMDEVLDQVIDSWKDF